MAKSLAVGTKVWADKINGAWRKSIEGVIEAGQHLLDAKSQCLAGDFERMLAKQLDFQPATARKLMAIARDNRLTDRSKWNALPDHWTTLYALTKLDDGELEQALHRGKETRARDLPTVIDVDHEDITPSADEADTPAIPVSHAAPGSAVPVHPDHPAGSEHAADDREVGESGHHDSSVFEVEPGNPSAVAVEMSDPISAAMEFARRVTADDYFAGLTANPDHEDVNHFANWIYDFEELVKLAKETEEAEAAA